MKLVRSLALLTGVLGGPTRPPNVEDAVECPTDCIEVSNTLKFMKGARPDYDYGETCDLEELHRKCQEEESVRTLVAVETRDFPDYIYEPLVSDGSRGDSEICTTFPDVCCPLMVAQNGIAEGVFGKKTTDLISNTEAEVACLAENNYPCCVKADLCKAYPDLPHCQEDDYESQIDHDAAGMSGRSNTIVTEAPTVPPTELPSEPSTAEPESTEMKTSTEMVTEARTEIPPTDAPIEPATVATTKSPAVAPSEVPTEKPTEPKTEEPIAGAIAAGPDVGPGPLNRDGEGGEDVGKDDEGETANQSGTKWWIVGGILGGIGAIVAGVVIAKRFTKKEPGFTEARLIVNQEKPSEPDQVSVDMQQEEQQLQ